MSLILYLHPLASFCQKALIAFYENATPFTPRIVDLGNEAERAALRELWSVGKFPVLRDEARGQTVPESSIIIEYLDQHYPGSALLLPRDADLGWQTRLRDRFYDLYVHEPMQRIVGDRLRPRENADPFGVEEASARLRASYDIIEREMADRQWAMGDRFTLADCAACPSLFYANKVLPFDKTHSNVADYFARLQARPSYARVLSEAEPYMKMFPQ